MKSKSHKINADGTVQCSNYQIEKPLVLDSKIVCTATHPQQPNYSGHSRGRKLHAVKDEDKTICNMLIDEYIPSSNPRTMNGKCKICFK